MESKIQANPELLLAQWVAPMDGPPIRDGAIAFANGKILAVGPAANLRRRFAHARATDLGAVTVLPGLVNAHVHLELSKLTAEPAPARFVDWLLRVMRQVPADPAQAAHFVQDSIEEGVRQCLRYGVTTVGDISRQCALTRPLLKNGPLRVISFGEVLAMASRRTFLEDRLTIAAAREDETGFLRVGISPHAPYSVETNGYRRCLQVAQATSLQLTTHLAETRDEAEFLASHTGPFRDLWDAIGGWDDSVPRFSAGPIRYAQSLGLLDYPTLLAHVNYCDDQELELLARGRASVVYCPRTHAYFVHPPHRWRDMLATGINLAIGTDSTASSPDLNLLDDLRLLHRIAPEVHAQILWELATIHAARALQLDRHIGSLSLGKAADFVVFPVASKKPLITILETDVLPSALWIGGNSILM